MRQTYLLSALPGALAASFPQQMGVDLVFPRDLETYRPTTPFPVVLAFHGAPSIWPPNLTVRLELRQPGEEPLETIVVNGTDAVGQLEEEDDGTYFAVVGMLETGDLSGDTFLKWEFKFKMDCDGVGHGVGASSSVRFSFDEEGDNVDVVPKGDYCPTHVHTVLVEGRKSEECLELGMPRLGDECRTEIPAGLERGVEAKLEEIRECANEDGDCNDSPFIEGNWEEGGDEDDAGDGSDENDESDDESAALSLQGGDIRYFRFSCAARTRRCLSIMVVFPVRVMVDKRCGKAIYYR